MDDSIEVYDYVLAETLENGDQITVENEDGGIDYLENIKVTSDKEAVMVKGFSYLTGDEAAYILPWDKAVGLWTV